METNMNVKISQAQSNATPASTMTDEIIEHVSALMMLCGGIESISSTKYASGFGERLHTTIAHFAKAPRWVKDQGVIIKDAIAKILSIANIAGVTITPTDEDLARLQDAWDAAVAEAKLANGSSQVFDADGSADSKEG